MKVPNINCSAFFVSRFLKQKILQKIIIILFKVSSDIFDTFMLIKDCKVSKIFNCVSSLELSYISRRILIISLYSLSVI